MSYNIDCFLDNLYEKNVPKYRFNCSNVREWERWHEELRSTLLKIFHCTKVEKTDLKPRLLENFEYESFFMQRVEYTVDELLVVPAYILIPKSKRDKFPAVIACHGHGYGSREIVGLNPDGSVNTGDPGCHKNFALRLVERGFLVIAPEYLGFGDLRLEEDRSKEPAHPSCDTISKKLMMFGKTTAGVRIYQTLRTIDYIESREDVMADRIGCMGFSGGGLVAAFTTAVDERIKASVVSGYPNTFKDAIMSIPHCIDNYIPGILEYAELPDIIGLIAPRPLMIESAAQDPIFPLHGVLKAHDEISKIYELLNAKHKLDINIFPGNHQIGDDRGYDWLEKWLRNR